MRHGVAPQSVPIPVLNNFHTDSGAGLSPRDAGIGSAEKRMAVVEFVDRDTFAKGAADKARVAAEEQAVAA